MQFPIPVLTVALLAAPLVFFAAVFVLEYKGRKYDGYKAVFGINPEHPFNKARKDL